MGEFPPHQPFHDLPVSEHWNSPLEYILPSRTTPTDAEATVTAVKPDSTSANSTSQMPVVKCSNVVRAYTRGNRGGLFSHQTQATTVTAVDNVSVTIDRGELVGIAGPSGSGKSTLLHLLAALETPDSGQVTINGTATTSLSERERTRLRRDHVGIVFQRFHLLPSLTATQNVALPLIEHGVGARERQSRAAALLEDVGLGDRLTHRPATLSGGEQQRVAVARALAGDPDVVIADEPTGELDSAASQTVLDLLADVAVDHAVVVASHDPAAIGRMDRVIRLRDGTRDTDGTA